MMIFKWILGHHPQFSNKNNNYYHYYIQTQRPLFYLFYIYKHTTVTIYIHKPIWDYETGDSTDFSILREFMRNDRADEEIELPKVNK